MYGDSPARVVVISVAKHQTWNHDGYECERVHDRDHSIFFLLCFFFHCIFVSIRERFFFVPYGNMRTLLVRGFTILPVILERERERKCNNTPRAVEPMLRSVRIGLVTRGSFVRRYVKWKCSQFYTAIFIQLLTFRCWLSW